MPDDGLMGSRGGAIAPVVVGIGELLWDLLPTGRELGGAPANFAFHAGALGFRGTVVSRVGDDDLGREILPPLEERGLDVSHVSTDPSHPTGTVSVKLDHSGKPDFTIREDVAWDYITLSPADRELARRCAAVCFGTLARRSPVSRAAVGGFLDAAGAECLRVFDVNLRQGFYDRDIVRDGLQRCDVLKLNDEELPVVRDLLGLPEAGLIDRLVSEFSLKLVAVTRGAKGALLATPAETAERTGEAVPGIVSTVGAGDAFTAAVVTGMLRGQELGDICERANRIAAYVCSRPGAMPDLPDGIR